MIRRGQASSAIHANMTPMIDVIFLLIVFFVAVSQIVDRDSIPLDLPSLQEPAAGPLNPVDKIVINIVPSIDDTVTSLLVSGHTITFNDLELLIPIVNTRLRGGAQEIHIRADKSTQYTYIHSILEVIKDADGTAHVLLLIDGEEV